MEKKELDFCLLVPCYNNVQGLIFSLRSIFYDTDHFAVVIVDDGSAIPVLPTQLESHLKNISSITVLRNEQNRGITGSLNIGLKWIEDHLQTKYIARLDCGDICHPNRFYKQIEYMNGHPDIGLLGSWCIFEDKKMSFRFKFKTPTDHEGIKKAMHLGNVFIHSTVIFRTSILKIAGNYPSEFMYAEDYAFYWKLIKATRSHILDEFLITYEIDREGLSLKNRQEQLKSRARIIATFGTNRFRKILGILRTKALRVVPNSLVLPLKQLIKER